MNSTDRTLRDIAQLASDRLGGVRGRALDREAKKLGLTLSYTTVDKILAGTYTSRPSRLTLQALAQLSGASLEEVHLAAGKALPQKPLADQLPPEVDSLTPDQRRVVIDLARVFVKQNQREQALLLQAGTRGNDDNQEQQEADPSGERDAGEARRSGGAGQGQKSGSSVASIVQLQIPDDDEVPADLAAHPNFETDRERFDRAHGAAGEESQVHDED